MKREKKEILDYLQKEIQEIRKLLLKKEKRDNKLFLILLLVAIMVIIADIYQFFL